MLHTLLVEDYLIQFIGDYIRSLIQKLLPQFRILWLSHETIFKQHRWFMYRFEPEMILNVLIWLCLCNQPTEKILGS